VVRIEKNITTKTLHEEPALSEVFVVYLLARNIQYETDLVDQLFDSSEKRLARTLLMPGHFGKEGAPETMVPKIRQESLAEMVGTMRSRVNFFMNKFRKTGFIDYARGGKLQVHNSLLNAGYIFRACGSLVRSATLRASLAESSVSLNRATKLIK
jgi:CRP/FNR family transcriptional regulator, cyclic AMP receptor protein